MKKLNLIFLALICLVSCKSNSVNIEPYEEGNIAFVNEVNLDAWPKTPYQYNWFKIVDDRLIINVSYGGGCKEHDFKLIIRTGIDKTNPPKTEALLSHNGNGDMCEAYLTEDVKFNIDTIRKHYQNTLVDLNQIEIKIINYESILIDL